MTTHVNKISGVCFYQRRRLNKIRRILSPDITARLVSEYIISRLDYCNSVLAGLPKSTTAPLQRRTKQCSKIGEATWTTGSHLTSSPLLALDAGEFPHNVQTVLDDAQQQTGCEYSVTLEVTFSYQQPLWSAENVS